MRDLCLAGMGFLAGIAVMVILITVADNREWVRNFRRKWQKGHIETIKERHERLLEERGCYPLSKD